MTDRAEHPSNRLYRGDVADFREAVRVHLDAIDYEARQARIHGYGDELSAPLAEARAEANRALAIYLEEVAEAERRIVARLRAAGLDAWADALEAGTYEGLAI
jgi:hypothetical protein